MADKCHIYLLGLLILHSPLTGTSEVKDVHVFGSYGENIVLSFNNNYSDCTTTTWIHRRESHSVPVTLFDKGIKMNDRLSLGSDCSLNIYNITKEDYGFYTRKKTVNGKDSYTDANVYLHFLHVSPSSTQTEIRPDSSVTLSCHFYSFDDALCKRFAKDGFQLVWVNESGVDLNSDSRYQISSSPDHCNSTLTTTLLNEENNREWRCQMKRRSEVKTLARYTVKYWADSKILDGSLFRVIIIIIEITVLTAPTVILLWIICERKADNRRKTQNSQMVDSQFQMSVLCSSVEE